jgi:archaemetzincin
MILRRFNPCCFTLLLTVCFFGCTQQKSTDLQRSEIYNTKMVIGLQAYRGFDTSLLAFIKNEVAAFYHCEVKIMPLKVLPQSAWYAPRSRYKADSLLVFQKSFAGNMNAVAGLTDKDISTTHGNAADWGVFGLGYCPGKTCVISTHRLYKVSKTSAQLKERLIKVVLHELGHNFNLPHCTNSPTCLMTDAGGTIAQVDREKKWLCDNCRKKIFL